MDTQKMRDALAKLHQVEQLDTRESKDHATRLIGELGRSGMSAYICSQLQDTVNMGLMNSFRYQLKEAWDYISKIESEG